jgi:lipopolysaccharide/colanic/teichoic acid biosynthesis glycosyltransferase
VLRLLLVSLSVILGFFLNNLYADTRVQSRVLLVLKMCNVIGIALIVQGLLAYVSSGLGVPRLVMLLGSAMAFVTLVAWRNFYGTVFLRIIGTRKILFVGKDELIDAIADRVQRHPESGYNVGGYVDSGDDLVAVATELQADRIIISCEERGRAWPIPALLNLVRKGVQVEEAATAYESICGRISARELSATQIIFRNELASRPGSVALQSVYTNLAAIVSFMLALPVIIAAAIAVKLTSRGPIFEPDLRIGQHGIPFTLNKFRCHWTAEDKPAATLEERVTPVGKWLRKLNLVDLPHVINLVRGEITLVGPRPERPEFVDELSKYFAYYRQRHAVKPGLTGWSQINTPQTGNQVDTVTQLEYDLYYTKHISLALDAYILLHGIRQLLPFARQELS